MKITFKLFAMLTDFLPAQARAGNVMELDVPAGATIAHVVEQFALPPRLVHLVLVNGSYVAPQAKHAHPAGRRHAGHLAADRGRLMGGADWPEAFEREMACTEADWLRWLPAAIGAREWDCEPGRATVRIDAGELHLAWRTGEPRSIALIRLPRLHVAFRFERVSAAGRHAFMNRFDLYMQRGGG